MLRIVKFAEAVANHVADGCSYVTNEQLSVRLHACESCEFRDGLFCGHARCGCLIWLKARWQTENCPAEPTRWPKIPCKK